MFRPAALTALPILALVACSSSSSSTTGTGGSAGAISTSSSAASSSGAGGDPTSTTSSTSSGGGAGPGISSNYPGDVGIASDPAVIWVEDFEEGSVAAVTARYDDKKNEAGMTLVPDVPPKSGGKASMRWVAGGSGPSATDVFKKLPDHDELYVRWYAKYQAGIPWHHTGVWIGGYDPPLSYPNPQAGLKPNGDDRFSVSIEPVFDIGQPGVRLDTYNYWMKMHSWMDQPMGDTAYYGNALIHQKGFTVDEEQWMCLEVHIRLNPDPTSAAGAMLEVWKNDVPVQSFDDTKPLGYWVKDKFCPGGADGPECTDYPPPAGTTFTPVDLQWRSSASLHLNAFWPQNYITDATAGAVQYDDMVVATARIGCLR
jgi:hypothetical protein